MQNVSQAIGSETNESSATSRVNQATVTPSSSPDQAENQANSSCLHAPVFPDLSTSDEDDVNEV